MRKPMYKVLSTLLALTMAVSLSACGSGSENSQDQNSTENDGEPVELVLWHPASFVYGDGEQKPEDTFAGQAIAQYEKEHNVKITIVSQPQDNFDNLFKAANIAKNGPDIVWLWPGSMTVDYAPFLLPLNDYLTDDIIDSHFGWELASEGYNSENTIYGIPFTSYIYVMYYNKALFQEAGLAEDDIPETWDEFLEVCETLKQAGITPFVCGAKDGYIGQWGISALLSTMLGSDTSLVSSGEPLSGTAYEEAAADSHFGWELASEGYNSENTIYGIPFTSYIYVMYYNKALFQEAGLAEDDIPETWDEFLEVCETLKQAGITPFVCGAKDGYIGQWGISALLSTMLGSDTSLVSSGEPLSGTAYEEAAALWAQLGENGYINEDALSYEANGNAVTEFINGNGAMYLNSDWVSDPIYEGLGDDGGIFPFPAADASNPNADYNYAGVGCNLCVVNYSQHTEEAVEFVKWFTSEEFELGYINEAGILPNCTTISEEDLTISDAKKEMYSLLKNGNNSIQVDLMPLNAFNTMVRNGSLLTMGKMDASEFTRLVDEELAKQ